MREYDFVVQKVALLVQAHYLAAVAESGVNGHRPFLTHWSRQQQLSQVFSEDIDGLDVGLLLCLLQDFICNGRLQKALERIVYRHADLFAKPCSWIAMLLTEVIVNLVAALLSVGVQAHGQETFILRPENRQKIVGRNSRQWHAEIEVRPVLRCVGRRRRGLGGLRLYPSAPENLTQAFAHSGRLGNPLGDDVPCAGERILNGRNAVIQILAGLRFRIGQTAGNHLVRKRLKPLFLSHGRTGAALRPVRQVQILQFAGNHTVLNL